MNPENILNNLQNMGPVFWVAATACALGISLLVVAMLTQMRRLKLKLPRFGSARLRRTVDAVQENPTTQAPAAADIIKTASGYSAATTAGPAQVAPPIQGLCPDTIALAARLKKAADTLEEIKQHLRSENMAPGFSGLKEEPAGVEYLFKTTVG